MIRILVAEDEPASRRLLVGYLRELPGVEVIGEAGHGAEALELARRLRPDALFLDIEMPGLKGTEVAAALPEPKLRLVFVTAYPQHAVEAFRLGAVRELTESDEVVLSSGTLSLSRHRRDALEQALGFHPQR